MIDFSELALSPNESRAARNFLGHSQAQVAEKSNLPAHKIKRFESGNYVPDAQFLEDLREFYEGEGYNFHDEDAPGAKAKARGDVFPAGVVGGTDGDTDATDGSPSENQGKLPRPQSVQLQFMRITPSLESAQVDRVFDCIEDNEEAIRTGMNLPIRNGFLSESPSAQTQAQAIALLRRLAENGLLYARLMGRELVSMPRADDQAAPDNFLLGLSSKAKAATVSMQVCPGSPPTCNSLSVRGKCCPLISPPFVQTPGAVPAWCAKDPPSTTEADYSNWPRKAIFPKEIIMSETVLVLRADRYEFTSEKTGEIIKGANVYFISDTQVETPNAVGDKPMKVAISDEVFNEIKHYGAPAIYDITTKTKPGKDGTATVVLTKAKFQQAFKLPESE